MEELQKQIEQISRRLEALEGRVPTSLRSELDLLQRMISEAAVQTDKAVAGTPTASGYIPFRINGQRVNIITTA